MVKVVSRISEPINIPSTQFTNTKLLKSLSSRIVRMDPYSLSKRNLTLDGPFSQPIAHLPLTKHEPATENN